MASGSGDAPGGAGGRCPPMAGAWDRILRALEELRALELRRLKAALNRAPVARGYRPLAWGRMEAADALDLTELILGHYGEGYGESVTGEALRSIERRDLAEWLLGGGAPARPADDASDDVADDAADDVAGDVADAAALRFVRRQRAALVAGVRAVGPLLDRLQARGALGAEAAAAVAAGETPQERMRRLLDTAPGWGPRGRRCFLRALRELQPGLMEELGPP